MAISANFIANSNFPHAELNFETDVGRNDYSIILSHADPDTLIFASERYRFSRFEREGTADWNYLDSGHRESRLINAANLAPFLFRLRENEPHSYFRIRDTIRQIHIIAEGATEESFVKTLLIEHLGNFNLSTDVRLVNIGKKLKRMRKNRGGTLNCEDVKKDIGRWLKEDRNADVRFTIMFDLYALPSNFPGYDEAQRCSDIYEKVQKLEQFFQEDIGDRRFLPYIQLHEFAALLLSDPAKFSEYYVEDTEAIQELIAMCSKFSSPEAINDGKETAPSKRI